MNKELKQIEKLEQQLEELKQTLQEQVSWTPSGDEFYVHCDGKVQTSILTIACRINGVEFGSGLEADKATKAYKLMHWQYKLATELNEGWMPDWSNKNEEKFIISYCYETNEYIITYDYLTKIESVNYYKDDKTARKAIEIMENWDI